MTERKTLIAGLFALLIGASVILTGCGKSVTLKYNRSSEIPVIALFRVQAIAPVYNPDAPVCVLYGDGTLVKKKGPYDFRSGKCTVGVSGILEKLSNYGFFDLKPVYEEEPLPGGSTEQIMVYLENETRKVSVQAGRGPKSWKNIINCIENARVSDWKEWIPKKIRLFAREGEAQGVPVLDWNGDASALQRAVASRGVTLEGENAEKAWRAIADAFRKNEASVTWKANGKKYCYVYANPVFPNLP
ncbi:MAG: hypothetical protein PHP64_01570 [Actinomycetota bacterium]|nr:hypothetical protein [Actinomycetota bacterium]